MTRKPFALAIGLAAASLAPAAPALARDTATPLRGSVGPGFTITLVKGGAKARSLKPGSYAITVSDKAASHDFHLIGPGVDRVITSVPFTGTKTVTVTLKAGTYTYQCDPHAASGMKGTFRVAAAPAAAVSPTTTVTDTTPSTGMGAGDGY